MDTIKKSNSKRFTLIELLVVVSILAVLAGGTLIVYDGIEKKTAKAQAKNDMQMLTRVIKNFRATNGGLYPENFDSLLKVKQSAIVEDPDTSYSALRGSLFPQFHVNASILDIAQGQWLFANFEEVSWLSEKLLNNISKLSITQEMFQQLVLSGIRSIRYVEDTADHNEPDPVDTIKLKVRLTDGPPENKKIGKSEDILNASQAFENITVGQDDATARNLGRGFTVMFSQDSRNLSKAIDLDGSGSGTIPFAILKPGIAGSNNVRVGAKESDILILLGIGKNCSIVNVKSASANINKLGTKAGILETPQYSAAKNNIYARYIAVFKVARFVDPLGQVDTSKINENNGEFILSSNSFEGEILYNKKSETAGLKINENGVQFVGVIDCYGNSSDDIVSQVSQ